mmetsp:Transcript_11945/g.17613  ORF Transcript_11945/g.17613 Transcript_11945/m.17613 type:complete len:203 (+) Transcript_11945:594-1202(+)
MKKSYGMSAFPVKPLRKSLAVLGYMLSVMHIPAVPSTSALWSYPYTAWRQTSMTAVLPPSYLIMMVAVSYASGPSSTSMDWSMWQAPTAMIASGSHPMRKRDMSRSWTAISLKMPPPPLTYSKGGGEGSREQSFTWMTLPTSPFSMACCTRAKLGSKRRCRAVMSFTPAFLQVLIASTVSGKSVAIGFSQNTCFPFLAQALI